MATRPLFPDNYIAACAAREITTGATPTTFAPGDPIKRAQLITMVVRAMESLHSGFLVYPSGTYVNTWGTAFSATHGPNARMAEFNGLPRRTRSKLGRSQPLGGDASGRGCPGAPQSA